MSYVVDIPTRGTEVVLVLEGQLSGMLVEVLGEVRTRTAVMLGGGQILVRTRRARVVDTGQVAWLSLATEVCRFPEVG
jgi:hypothetical protein